MPLSAFYYNPSITAAKQLTETYFWSRPTVAWSLACEAKGQTRAEAYKMISQEAAYNDDPDNWYAGAIFWTTIVGILFLSTFLSIVAYVKGVSDGGRNILI